MRCLKGRWRLPWSLVFLLAISCSDSSESAHDASIDGSRDAVADDSGDTGLSYCCPLDYYLCDGGRRGGKRPADGVCPKIFDEAFAPRVETVDEYGCPIIDLKRSTSRSCELPFPIHDGAALDAQTDVPGVDTAADAAVD